MSNVKSYFEKNAHLHVYHNDPQIYDAFSNFTKGLNDGIRNRLLDIGCGEGPFIKYLSKHHNSTEFFGTDISLNMIKRAKDNIDNPDVILMVSDGFNLPFHPNTFFETIHADSVLHHIIGRDRKSSKILVREMLEGLVKKIPNEGILIIEEVYYDSYLHPTLTSSIIFYLLKILNLTRLDLGKIYKEFSPGLEVNFYNEKELYDLLRSYGSVKLVKRIPWKVPKLYKIFLLEKYGHVSYVVKIKKS